MAEIKSFGINDDPIDRQAMAEMYEKREAGIKKLHEEIEAGKAAASAQEIKLDDSNLVSFPGFPYKFEALHEKILVSIDIFKSGYECKICLGKKKIEVKGTFTPGIGYEMTEVTCPECKGRGALLILPDASKNLPSTGVVVSMGKKARELASFGVGDRILFSPHAGQMIPTKAGLMFKWMDWYNGGVKITGADELSAFDFIMQDE